MVWLVLPKREHDMNMALSLYPAHQLTIWSEDGAVSLPFTLPQTISTPLLMQFKAAQCFTTSYF